MGEMRNIDVLSSHTRLTEEAAILDRIVQLDGLQPTQVVRKWIRAGGGVDSSIAGDFIDKLDEKADANATTTVAGTRLHDYSTQGMARYVANPRVQKAQYAGLFVGSILQYQYDQKTNTEMVFQTLTRVHTVGSWSVSGTAVNVNPDSGDSASAVLTKCRPMFRQSNQDDSPYRSDWPGSDAVEARWMHWTHESKDPLLALTNAEIQAVLAHHAPESKDWRITKRTFEIDPETNGGVFTIECVAKTVYKPQNVNDLANQPHRTEPVQKERVRIFGLDHQSKGEGWYYTLVCEWWDISPDNRQYIEWIDDTAATTAVVRPLFPDESPYVRNARHWIVRDDGREYPWWRVHQIEVSVQEDGLLGLKVVWEMAEIGNLDEAVVVELYGGEGWGQRRTETLPTVPTEKAPAVAEALPGRSRNVRLVRSVNERDKGFSDVVSQYHRVWKYLGAEEVPPGMPTYTPADGSGLVLSAPMIEYRPDLGCSGGGGVALTWFRVASDAVNQVVARGVEAVTPSGQGIKLRSVVIREDEDGSCEVRVEGHSAKFSPHFASIVSGDFFTTVYRREYDGVYIDFATGKATDEAGSEVVLKDALGNVVPTKNVSSGAALMFKTGTRISAQFSRDEECRYHVVVTTEVAVARDWEYQYATNRNGHPDIVRVHAWRNWASRPAAFNAVPGTAVSFRDDMNSFGLHDGQSEAIGDIFVKRRDMGSENAFQKSESVTVNVDGGRNEPPVFSPGTIVTASNDDYSDLLHDRVLSTVTAKPQTWEWTWSQVYYKGKRAPGYGYAYRNFESPPRYNRPGDGDGYVYDENVNKRMNEFGLFDGEVMFVPRHDGGGNAGQKSMFYGTYVAETVQHREGKPYSQHRDVTTTTSFHTSKHGAEIAVNGGYDGSHIEGPFNSLLGKTMWKAVHITFGRWYDDPTAQSQQSQEQSEEQTEEQTEDSNG